jgi:Raf kinase inhibitor-like YbhB/YbcL family protein
MPHRGVWSAAFIVAALAGVAVIVFFTDRSLRTPASNPSLPISITPQDAATNMKISSSAFQHGGSIPKAYTCDGGGKHPPIGISDVPTHAASLALVVNDPDAPRGSFTHWIIWNIPPKIGSIGEGETPAGAVQGSSSAGTAQWVSPCPPSGTHRYVFTLYALDKALDLKEGSTKDELLSAMGGHILETAELMGRYGR